MTITAWITIAILTLLVIVLFFYNLHLHRQVVREQESLTRQRELWQGTNREYLRQIVEVAKAVQPRSIRYQIIVRDWGEDFTGEDGTLHRWRWVVSDADQEIRKIVGIEDKYAPNYLMLGNEPTYPQAFLMALRWVEQQQYPEIVVIGADL